MRQGCLMTNRRCSGSRTRRGSGQANSLFSMLSRTDALIELDLRGAMESLVAYAIV